MALFLTEQDVTAVLTIEETIVALEEVFRAQAAGAANNEPRHRTRAAGATLHVLSAAVGPFRSFKGLLGLKSYSVTRHGARFHVTLYDAESGALLAFIEADRLGQMRTGAASGVATKYLARPNAQTVGIYGTGWQARSQLAAVCAVRQINEVRVYSRRPENRERFCDEMRAELKIDAIHPASQPAEAATADIIITITSSREPVLEGAWLKPGAHLNAAGSNSLLRREFDDEAIKRAETIIVDSLEQARLEAGELVNAVEKGVLTWERTRELRAVVSGEVKGRKSDDQITLFKSLGLAIEDIATAAIIYERARERGLGKEI
jgi:ornithine cyclodeaminase/alanine dehydrogenase-like protein (mu-crystallin family)